MAIVEGFKSDVSSASSPSQQKDEGLTLETSIKKTTLLCYTPHGHSNTVSLETYPLCSIWYWSHKRLRTRVTLLYVIHFTWNKEFDISYSFSVFMGRPFFVCTEIEFFFSTKGGKEPVVVWGNIFNGFWI